jgi:cell division protein FtsI (penicillin-binding protein 3)
VLKNLVDRIMFYYKQKPDKVVSENKKWTNPSI